MAASDTWRMIQLVFSPFKILIRCCKQYKEAFAHTNFYFCIQADSQ